MGVLLRLVGRTKMNYNKIQLCNDGLISIDTQRLQSKGEFYTNNFISNLSYSILFRQNILISDHIVLEEFVIFGTFRYAFTWSIETSKECGLPSCKRSTFSFFESKTRWIDEVKIQKLPIRPLWKELYVHGYLKISSCKLQNQLQKNVPRIEHCGSNCHN